MSQTITKNLSVGEHTVTVSCNGYESYSAVIYVSSAGTVSCRSVSGGSCSSSSRPGMATSGSRVTVYMKTKSTACPTPTASFTYSPSSPGSGDRVTFRPNALSGGSGVSVTDYLWDYGDGGSGRSNYHSYSRAGTFTVKLTVTNSCGGTRAVTKQVTVSSGGASGSSTTKPVSFVIPNGATITVS